MPALDVSNPKVINFLLENYEKESKIRMKWVKLHAGNFEKAATFTREEKSYTLEDINKYVVEAGMAATTRDYKSSARNRTTLPVPDYEYVKIKVPEKEPELVMKPPTSDEKIILRESSEEYLKRRNLLKPEDKYSFIECSSWKYGWKLSDSMLKTSGPKHGKVNHLLRNLRSHVGPQKDPDHYKSPDPGLKVYDSI